MINRDGGTKIGLGVNDLHSVFNEMYIDEVYEAVMVVENISYEEMELFEIISKEYMYVLVEDNVYDDGTTELIYINEEY